MNVNIVPEKCIACGLCQVLAPDVFDYTDDGIVIFSTCPTQQSLMLPDHLTNQTISAYKKCPTRAIVIEKTL